MPWTQWAMLVWLFGVVVVLGRLALAHAGARLLVNRASHVDDEEWHLMAESAAHRLGVRRLVRLRMSTWTSVPMAVGVFKPVIVLPADADTWNEERKHAVLLHEVAHVKRHDCLFQLLTNIVTALYWFNPLVWIAAWQMRIERERSADDLVIVSGADASRYAETLLETAQIEIDIPEMDIHVPEITIPEIDVEIPEIRVDVPGFKFVMPAIKIPAFDVDIPEIVIDIPAMDFDIPEFEWDEEPAYPRTPVDSLSVDQIR